MQLYKEAVLRIRYVLSQIPDPDPTIASSRIPDPGGKKAPDPGSGTLKERVTRDLPLLNTGCVHV
jgi:hypothetical protein